MSTEWYSVESPKGDGDNHAEGRTVLKIITLIAGLWLIASVLVGLALGRILRRPRIKVYPKGAEWMARWEDYR